VAALTNSTGTKAVKANAASGSGGLQNPIGLAFADYSAAATASIISSGETPDITDNTVWESSAFPVQATDIGKRVYLSATTAGCLTLTEPSGSGDRVVRVGIVSKGGSATSRVFVQIGEGATI
jgi:hypothetical protein